MKENTNTRSSIEINNWHVEDVPFVHRELCEQNWPPWLVVPIDSINGRIKVFPQGQLLARNHIEKPVGYTFINRVNWSGKVEELTSWKEIAGVPTTFEKTYTAEGNTLVLMSMNVHQDSRGTGLARKLITKGKDLATELNIKHLIGSFRPNQYGKYKLENTGFTDFTEYCHMKRDDGLPLDQWLRNLIRNGMEMLKEDSEAMKAIFTLEEFYNFQQTYKPQIWFQTAPNIWECGETGQWIINKQKQTATYLESAMWGKINI